MDEFKINERSTCPLKRDNEEVLQGNLLGVMRAMEMKEIKAFVGHSFLPSDNNLIRKFLDYFDGLQKSHPSFSWQNAKTAEPKMLTAKVMEIIADKNTFIGICTRNERVVSHDQLRPCFFQPSKVQAPKEAFAWKTSDWIIQEIGMAIGKGLDVILLLENGVRKPGGLQGDLEYIPFEREAPEGAFLQILEMLSALSPPPRGQLAVTENVAIDNAEKPPSDDEEFEMPDGTWNRDKFESAIFSAIYLNRNDKTKLIDDAYKQTPDSAFEDNATSWQAYLELVRILVGKGGQLDRLKTLADNSANSARTLAYLAQAYGNFDRHTLSGETYLAATKLTSITEKKKADYARNAARQFQLGKDSVRVEESLQILRAIAKHEPEAAPILASAVQDISEIEKDDDFIIALLEYMIELRPADYGARFSLAFKQSAAGNEAIAMHHYLKIPFAERTPAAWNNLGVAFGELELPAKAVSAFKSSAEKGETLAMSNLGNKLMTSGFVELAREQCNNALKQGYPHKNVGTLLASLGEISESEDKRQGDILDGVEKRISYLQRLGQAATSEPPQDFGETWQGPDCALRVVRSGNRIRLHGTYERDANMLSSLLYSAVGSTAPAKPKDKYSVEYFGKFKGRAVIGEMKRTREGASILESASGDQKIFMMLSEDDQELSILEGVNRNDPIIHILKRVQAVIAQLH